MTDQEKSLEEKLKVLELMFLGKLPGRLAEIEQALEQFLAAPEDKEALQLMHRLLHTMAGTAGTFGFNEVGEAARLYDNQLKALLAGEAWTPEMYQSFAAELTAYVAATYAMVVAKNV